MGKHLEHSENVEKLENELRKFAVPYSSEEPGPAYWANFRVRVMDRIMEEENSGLLNKVSKLNKITGWFGDHALQTGIAFSAAAALVIGALLFHPFSKSTTGAPAPVAALPPSSISPANSSHSEQPAVPQRSVPQQSAPQQRSEPMDHDIAAVAKPAQYINPHRTDRAIESKDDLAVVSEPISDASDHGVSLQELSQPELEAVLQDLQSNE